MPETHTVCSECASDQHTWKTCPSNTKECLNCHGSHRTLANKCPMRGKIKEEKRKQNINSNKSYSQATQNTNNSNNTNIHNINIEKDTATKILTCILHSHMHNIANPGSYNDELNKLLKLNNLPSIILPPNPPSKSIMNPKADHEIITKEVQVANEPEEETEIEEIEEEAEETLLSTQATGKLKLPQPTPSPKIQGKNIGLKLITKRTAGWPEDLDPAELKNDIKKGIYKFTYTSTAYSDEEILSLIAMDKINLSGVFTTLDSANFNKIRCGVEQESTTHKKVTRTTNK
ncbi:hypothetical protein E2C01_079110 [Portunus trituberculatus]|uniref:Uncharacterized protein n=1 Tax=Portunus trituberculatus TaxID=210409 RepID=A0A5B7IKM0_PORTR|nr:hypothetical protein [Portunus trituberculatus]